MKRLKYILVVLVILPLLVLSACGEPTKITLSQYNSYVKDAGDLFTARHSKFLGVDDFVIQTEDTDIEYETRSVTFRVGPEGVGSTVTEPRTFKRTTNKTQDIVVYNKHGASVDVKFTQIETDIEEGYRANGSTRLLETYVTKSIYMTEITYIKVQDKFVQYAFVKEMHYDGITLINEIIRRNTVYSYNSTNVYNGDIQTFLNFAISNTMGGFFDTEDYVQYHDCNMWEKGNEFGLDASYVFTSGGMSSGGYLVSGENASCSIRFEGGLPRSYRMHIKTSGQYGEDVEMVYVKVKYDSIQVSPGRLDSVNGDKADYEIW